jgi:hypothetical protein
MAVALVSGQEIVNGAATANPTTAAMPASVTVGNVLVAVTANDSGTANYLTSVTDSKGNGWTRKLTYAAGRDVEIWTTPVTAGGTGLTVTFGFALTSASNLAWSIREYSGTTTTVASSAGNATGTSTAVASAASTGSASIGDLVIAGVGLNGTSTVTAGSGYSNASVGGSAAAFVATEWKAATASGTQTAAMTLGTSVTWNATLLVLQAGAYTGRPRPTPAFIRM